MISDDAAGVFSPHILYMPRGAEQVCRGASALRRVAPFYADTPSPLLRRVDAYLREIYFKSCAC